MSRLMLVGRVEHSSILIRCQIKYRYDLYGKRHLGEGRLLSFGVPLLEERHVSQTEHSTTLTRVVPVLRRSAKMVIRWDSAEQKYTAQRPLFPVTQRITVSRTTFGDLKKIGEETNVSKSEVRPVSDTDAFSGTVVERSRRPALAGKLGATVTQCPRLVKYEN
jgi:hypothetical protein